ncbi:alpha/beta fold hydrolase [Streptomyces sp. NBC_01619]|uniref:thioesterase II family protein n=1 Tax=Streptomyces sp. NBC_01619 TaxID=2975901 RepID=UPI00338E0982
MSRIKQLFCFPHAGGNASMYQAWNDLLPVQVVSIEYPGHGRRICESLTYDLNTLARQLTSEITRRASGPYAFFGHSMGALVAFELTRTLQRESYPGPEKLYVAASPAPVSVNSHPNFSPLDNDVQEEAQDVLGNLGGTPPEVLACEELMKIFLPILKADLSALRSYRCPSIEELRIPIAAFGGEGDSAVDRTSLSMWGQLTDSDFREVLFPGDHFFLRTHLHELVEVLTGDLNNGSRVGGTVPRPYGAGV